MFKFHISKFWHNQAFTDDPLPDIIYKNISLLIKGALLGNLHIDFAYLFKVLKTIASDMSTISQKAITAA